MLSTLLYILLQPEVSGGATSAPATGGGATPAPPGCGGGPTDFLFIAAMFLVLYFLMIRPQQKKAKEHDAMLKAIKKGDHVRTNGGVLGEVTAIDEKDVTLLISERTRIKVLRSHIAAFEQVEAQDK